MTKDKLERAALRELMLEATEGALRAHMCGALGWHRDTAPAIDQSQLKRTIRSLINKQPDANRVELDGGKLANSTETDRNRKRKSERKVDPEGGSRSGGYHKTGCAQRSVKRVPSVVVGRLGGPAGVRLRKLSFDRKQLVAASASTCGPTSRRSRSTSGHRSKKRRRKRRRRCSSPSEVIDDEYAEGNSCKRKGGSRERSNSRGSFCDSSSGSCSSSASRKRHSRSRRRERKRKRRSSRRSRRERDSVGENVRVSDGSCDLKVANSASGCKRRHTHRTTPRSNSGSRSRSCSRIAQLRAALFDKNSVDAASVVVVSSDRSVVDSEVECVAIGGREFRCHMDRETARARVKHTRALEREKLAVEGRKQSLREAQSVTGCSGNDGDIYSRTTSKLVCYGSDKSGRHCDSHSSATVCDQRRQRTLSLDRPTYGGGKCTGNKSKITSGGREKKHKENVSEYKKGSSYHCRSSDVRNNREGRGRRKNSSRDKRKNHGRRRGSYSYRSDRVRSRSDSVRRSGSYSERSNSVRRSGSYSDRSDCVSSRSGSYSDRSNSIRRSGSYSERSNSDRRSGSYSDRSDCVRSRSGSYSDRSNSVRRSGSYSERSNSVRSGSYSGRSNSLGKRGGSLHVGSSTFRTKRYTGSERSGRLSIRSHSRNEISGGRSDNGRKNNTCSIRKNYFRRSSCSLSSDRSVSRSSEDSERSSTPFVRRCGSDGTALVNSSGSKDCRHDQRDANPDIRTSCGRDNNFSKSIDSGNTEVSKNDDNSGNSRRPLCDNTDDERNPIVGANSNRSDELYDGSESMDKCDGIDGRASSRTPDDDVIDGYHQCTKKSNDESLYTRRRGSSAKDAGSQSLTTSVDRTEASNENVPERVEDHWSPQSPNVQDNNIKSNEDEEVANRRMDAMIHHLFSHERNHPLSELAVWAQNLFDGSTLQLLAEQLCQQLVDHPELLNQLQTASLEELQQLIMTAFPIDKKCVDGGTRPNLSRAISHWLRHVNGAHESQNGTDASVSDKSPGSGRDRGRFQRTNTTLPWESDSD